jgi:hypothetical protein
MLLATEIGHQIISELVNNASLEEQECLES